MNSTFRFIVLAQSILEFFVNRVRRYIKYCIELSNDFERKAMELDERLKELGFGD